MHQYQSLICKALKHIANEQDSDGGFSHSEKRKTTFFTSNILLCLHSLADDDILKPIREKAARFLLKERSEDWTFNYWAKNSQEYSSLPYPDDLDDTFAALAALATYDHSLIDPQVAAKVVQLLIAYEAQEGGPFKTWVANDTVMPFQDVDIVVNSTIGYFLSLINVATPNIGRFIAKEIRNNGLASRYYPGPHQAAYFLARFYQAADIPRSELLDQYLAQSGQPENLLEIAMSLSSLIRLEAPFSLISERERALVTNFKEDQFLAYPFCMDPSKDGEKQYAGASALTAAFAIEALMQCRNYFKEASADIEQFSMHDHIKDLAKTQCANSGPHLSAAALEQIEKISDKRITSVAGEFYRLIHAERKSAPADLIEKLAIANLYGWMAYAIYDDILDGESGGTALLPCANLFLRNVVEIYSELDKNIPGAKGLSMKFLNVIDDANLWEQQNCRSDVLPAFGAYENLASRSIGHALGPLTLLLSMGYSANAEEFKNILGLFEHYLIARQLNDDAHDWEADLLRGQINSVGALIKRKFNTDDISELRKIFWESVIVDVVDLILIHTTAARVARKDSGLFPKADFMESTLSQLETIAHSTLEERRKTLEFLKHYQSH